MESLEWFHVWPSAKPTVEEAKALATSLDELNVKCLETVERVRQTETSILKRLEWASSTNVGLKDTRDRFEHASRRNRDDDDEARLFGELVALTRAWSSFEEWRVAAAAADDEFETLLRLVDESPVMDAVESDSRHQLSDVELNLVQFHKFNDKTQLNTGIIQVSSRRALFLTLKFIKSKIKTIKEYYNMLFDELAQIKRQKQKEEKECASKLEEMSKALVELKSNLSNHNRIMADIKPLLKQMSRYESSNVKLHEYSKNYNQFSEMCQNLLRCISNQVR